MTKEVPGIRPAVISTETGSRLDEYRRFRYGVRNMYTHRFNPAKLGKRVHSAPELFARTKAELLAFAAVYSPFHVFHMSHVSIVIATLSQHLRDSIYAIVESFKKSGEFTA